MLFDTANYCEALSSIQTCDYNIITIAMLLYPFFKPRFSSEWHFLHFEWYYELHICRSVLKPNNKMWKNSLSYTYNGLKTILHLIIA